MNGNDREDIRDLRTRLFGPDGQTGGVLGEIQSDLADIKGKVDRWDGAITFVKVGSGLIGFGGLLTILRALIP